jgi:uncharacterized protein YodC (DUF2158 family)
MKFRVGDVVRLKSGGPAMTIQKLGEYPSDQVECRWFTDEQECKWGSFPPACLKLARSA